MFYIYILQSLRTGRFYKGSTANIENRLSQHFSGKCTTTRKMLPLKLIHVEICETLSEARKLELFYKTGVGREIISSILALSSSG